MIRILTRITLLSCSIKYNTINFNVNFKRYCFRWLTQLDIQQCRIIEKEISLSPKYDVSKAKTKDISEGQYLCLGIDPKYSYYV